MELFGVKGRFNLSGRIVIVGLIHTAKWTGPANAAYGRYGNAVGLGEFFDGFVNKLCAIAEIAAKADIGCRALRSHLLHLRKSFHCLFNVAGFIKRAESEILPAGGPEACAGCACYTGFFEYGIEKFPGIKTVGGL